MSEGFFYLFKAALANSLSAEENYVVCVIAENTGGLIFLEDDFVFIREYLKRILFVDIHGLSDADGKNYSSELVYFSYHTC